MEDAEVYVKEKIIPPNEDNGQCPKCSQVLWIFNAYFVGSAKGESTCLNCGFSKFEDLSQTDQP